MTRSWLIAAAALAFVLSGCQGDGPEQAAPTAAGPRPASAPALAPVKVVNGALLALKTTATWITVLGHPPAFQPRDSESYATIQFTPDGKSAVYADQVDRITILDVTNGDERMLVRCPPSTSCGVSSLSPDGRVLAFGSDDGVVLVHLGTGEVEHVQPAGIGSTFVPTWSPDGALLAFVSGPRLYTMRADGTGLRTVFTGDDPDTQLRSLSWSPDGRSIAFIEGTPFAGNRKKKLTDDRFTATTVDVADGGVTALHDVGHCYCLGLSPPSLTWSPDGRVIAVATTQGMLGDTDDRTVGVYTIGPDGTGWTQVSGGLYDALAWQPIID